MKIIEYFKKTFEISPLLSISQDQAKNLFPKLENGFHAADPFYNSVNKEDIERVMAYWFFRFAKWTERRDCDNYSDLFMGIAKWLYPTRAIGSIWVKTPTGGHALNFFIWYDFKNKEFNWSYIEPQTAEIFDLTDKKVLNYRPFYVRI